MLIVCWPPAISPSSLNLNIVFRILAFEVTFDLNQRTLSSNNNPFFLVAQIIQQLLSPSNHRLNYTITLFASVLFDSRTTNVTLNITTPLKFTSALPCSIQLMCVVSPTATQQVTSIDTIHRSITISSVRTQAAQAVVLFAVIWWWL